MTDPLGRYPAEIEVRHGDAVTRYRRADDALAVRGADAVPARARVLATFDDADLVLCAGDAGAMASDLEPTRWRAAYRLAAGAAPAVATGRVLVRFAAEDAAERHASAIERAGYRIIAVLDYAPNAAWLEATSGDAAAALAGLDALRGLAGVEHVEPQMLMAAEHR
ncbi:MAG: hypothetical protein H6983_13810 [Ectothiorhodospiraceae bacterium]|nr:hypothetical protein [Ectothiorhodospiraceae bacterium]